MFVRTILLNNLTTVVRRAIIKNNQFKVLIGLIQYALDASIKIRSVVIVGDYDRYFWTHFLSILIILKSDSCTFPSFVNITYHGFLPIYDAQQANVDGGPMI